MTTTSLTQGDTIPSLRAARHPVTPRRCEERSDVAIQSIKSSLTTTYHREARRAVAIKKINSHFMSPALLHDVRNDAKKSLSSLTHNFLQHTAGFFHLPLRQCRMYQKH